MACRVTISEDIALKQPPVNWGPRSLQMMWRTKKTVSQCPTIMTGTSLASNTFLRAGRTKNVATLSVDQQDHTIETFFSDVHFGHGEEVHGHALHGLIRNRCPLRLHLDVLIVRIAGPTDLTTLLDLLDGIVETDLMDSEPALHVQDLLLNPWVHDVE